HGKGDAETFVKKKKKQKNEYNRGNQNDGKTTEGDLLLFVKSAETVEHVVRNHVGADEFLFHFANRRAEIAAADARGYRNHALEIVAHDFGLPAQRNERGDAFQRKQMTVRRTQKQIVDVAHGFAAVRRIRNATPNWIAFLCNMYGFFPFW